MTTAKDHFQEDMHKRPEELQREADDLRADVEQTVEALMNQFSPGELITQAISRFRSSGDSAFVHNLSRQIQNNPIPAVLTGAGLLWLMSASKEPPARASASSGDGMAGARDKLGSAAGQAQASAQGLKEQAHDRKERMAAGAADLKERASETGHQALERARSGARSAQDSYQQLLSEQPLVVGALAIAAGAALGALFPRTRGENQAIGDVSDQQTQALKQKAEGLAEKAEDKARDTLHRQQGATGGSTAAGASSQPEGQSATPQAPYNPPAGASGHPGSVHGGAAGHEPPLHPRDTDSLPGQPGMSPPESNRPHHRP